MVSSTHVQYTKLISGETKTLEKDTECMGLAVSRFVSNIEITIHFSQFNYSQTLTRKYLALVSKMFPYFTYEIRPKSKTVLVKLNDTTDYRRFFAMKVIRYIYDTYAKGFIDTFINFVKKEPDGDLWLMFLAAHFNISTYDGYYSIIKDWHHRPILPLYISFENYELQLKKGEHNINDSFSYVVNRAWYYPQHPQFTEIRAQLIYCSKLDAEQALKLMMELKKNNNNWTKLWENLKTKVDTF